MNKPTQIFSTKHYGQFYLIEGNRPINERHVKELMMSMTEEECVSPIQVNEKMEIIDGQHRFRALQELKLPIHYYILKGASIKTVQRLNSYTKNWLSDDYLNSYVDAGYKDYKLYKEFKDAYKFGNSIILLLLTNSYDRGAEEVKFKNGQFKISNWDNAVVMAGKLERMSQHITWYKERSWCYALIRALKTKGFDYDKFLGKLIYQSRKLVKCANTKQYLALIEEIYNHMNRGDGKVLLKDI